MGSIHSYSVLSPHKIVVDTEVTLKVTALGQDKRAYAVKVTGILFFFFWGLSLDYSPKKFHPKNP
jgi:hypothetical protein